MKVNQSLETLSDMFKDQDWFFDVGLDEYNRLVVYIKYMCEANLKDIPASINGQQIVVHFASSHTATREHYTSPNAKSSVPPPSSKKLELVSDDEFSLYYCKHSVEDLGKELDRLEKICGSNILQDIFYEVHDGDNAVTQLSNKFPEVKDSVEKLYDEYGFDIIYEELDG